MKTSLFIGLFILLSWTTLAQTIDSVSRPQIGIELLRMPFNLLLKEDSRPVRSLISIEPTVRIATKKLNRFIVMRVGYQQFSDVAGLGNIELSGKGGFLKAGIQSRRTDWVGFGLLGTVSVWHSQGAYRFTGPFFGDYVKQLESKITVSAGLEGITEFYAKLGGRWSLAIPVRLNITISCSPREFAELYVLGNGATFALLGVPALRAGAGVNLYLLYQL